MNRLVTVAALFLSLLSIKAAQTQVVQHAPTELFDQLAELDSVLFATVYTCNPAKASSSFTEDLEFYHDKGGVTKSRKTFIEALEKNFCGEQKQKLRRELVKGSLRSVSYTHLTLPT